MSKAPDRRYQTRKRRLPKQAMLSVALLPTFAMMTPLAIAQVTFYGGTPNQDYTLTNDNAQAPANLAVSGTIATSGRVAVAVTGALGTLQNAGKISATTSAIRNTGTIGALINAGTIQSGATNKDLTQGIYNDGGTIDTLLNTGSVLDGSSGAYADAIVNDSGIINSLNNSGTLSGSSSGILNQYATIKVLTNNGLISGSGGITATTLSIGILNLYGTIGTIANNGTIRGNDGIVQQGSTYVVSSIGEIDNQGTIFGDIAGIAQYVSTNGTIINHGLIEGGTIGISNTIGSTIGTIINTGTITGKRFALFNDAKSTMGLITNSGLIAGNIENDAAKDLAIDGGSGTVFGTLTGYGATIGTLTNTASNVVFSTGNLLLNDNVDLRGTSESNTLSLNNTGAVVQINNPVTINGNYHQSAAGTLLIGVADGAVAEGATTSASGYGRLVVSGSVVIDSGSHVTLQKLNNYGFAAGQRFVVVDAALAGTNYNVDTLIYGIAGVSGAELSATIVNTATNSDLVFTIAGIPNTTATTPNAIALFHGLNAYPGINDSALLNLYNAAQALNNGTSEEANKAGAQLSPVAQTQSIRVAALPTFDTLDVIGARVDALRLARDADNRSSTDMHAPHAAQVGLWGQVFGGHAAQGGRNQVDGYTANYGGLILGIDKALNDQWRAGGALSYSNAAMYSTGDASGDATHIDNYGFFGYASYTAPRWYANLSAGIAAQHYDENRAINFPGFSANTNGSFGGTQWVARGELGYPLTLAAFTLTPLANVTYAYLHQNGYTESGGDGAALRVNNVHATSVQTDIGAKLERAVSTRYGVLVPSVELTWRHQYANAKTTVDANFAASPFAETAFSQQGALPVADSGVLAAGITVLRANNLSVTAQYQVQAGSGFLSQAGTLRLRQMF